MQAIKTFHVNLVDLHECWRLDRMDKLRHFGSVRALARYTRQHKKILSRDDAKEGGLLRYLLRPIYPRPRRSQEQESS